jgi:hypothetical protein
MGDVTGDMTDEKSDENRADRTRWAALYVLCTGMLMLGIAAVGCATLLRSVDVQGDEPVELAEAA